MTTQTQQTIRAAKHWTSWGRWATIRYLQKRNIPLRLWYLARQCEALASAGI